MARVEALIAGKCKQENSEEINNNNNNKQHKLGTKKEKSHNMMCHKDISAKHVKTIMRMSQSCWDFSIECLRWWGGMSPRRRCRKCVFMKIWCAHMSIFMRSTFEGWSLTVWKSSTHSLLDIFTSSSIFCHSHQLLSISWKSLYRMTSNDRENYYVIFITTLIIRLECLSISVNYLMALLSEIILAFDLPILTPSSLNSNESSWTCWFFKTFIFRLELQKKLYTS